MNPYDVYGIGNALVDYEFKVSDDDLKKLSVDKSIMTLIDSERHQQLKSHLGDSYHKRACGGSAANSIIAIAQLGGQSFYSCRVANDATGDFYLEDMATFGVDHNDRIDNSDKVTGECIVLVTDDAERSMNTFLGATKYLARDVIVPEAICKSQYLYIEGYLSAEPNALEAALEAQKIAHQNGVKVALTLSDPNMVRFCKTGLDALVNAGLDLLFCNEQEAIEYSGSEQLDVAIEVLKSCADTVVVTRGDKGAIICHADEQYPVATEKVTAVDTTGAGDMFAGCYLFALTKNQTHQMAARLANFASGMVIQRFGPRLDKVEAELLQAFVKENFS